MQHRVGERFCATVVEVTKNGGWVQINDPAILAPVDGATSAGAEVMVKLAKADVVRRSVRFQVVGTV